MKKTFHLLIAVILLCNLLSCSSDDNNNNQNPNEFTVPELTLSNTIQFTVNANVSRTASVYLKGGKIAVDWGDGEITKRFGKSSDTDFKHTYRQTGEYRVKIWADEVTFINLSSLLKDYRELHVGNCPLLEDATLNSFVKDKSVDLNGCKALKLLNLGNWKQLESIALDQCTQLYEANIYTHPKLKFLDLSKNANLEVLHYQDCAIENILLHKNITQIRGAGTNLTTISLPNYKELLAFECSRSEHLTSIDLTGCNNLKSISFDQTSVESFDFSAFPNLVAINCGNSQMPGVDVSTNKSLIHLFCAGLNLASLDISANTVLGKLDCSNNKLTTLNVDKNKYLRKVFINNNKFSKEALEALFKALPPHDPKLYSGFPVIKFFGNPGVETCDTKIITDKGWLIKGE